MRKQACGNDFATVKAHMHKIDPQADAKKRKKKNFNTAQCTHFGPVRSQSKCQLRSIGPDNPRYGFLMRRRRRQSTFIIRSNWLSLVCIYGSSFRCGRKQSAGAWAGLSVPRSFFYGPSRKWRNKIKRRYTVFQFLNIQKRRIFLSNASMT